MEPTWAGGSGEVSLSGGEPRRGEPEESLRSYSSGVRPPREVELVTSDQPLINLMADIVGEDGFPRDFSLYLPVCSEFAVLCEMGSDAPGVGASELLASGKARHLNNEMAKNSYRQIFARRRQELDELE